MANPDQKTLLIESALKDFRQICKRFQEDSGATNSEVKTLLKKIINEFEEEKKEKIHFGFR